MTLPAEQRQGRAAVHGASMGAPERCLAVVA
jgi:hypothetical protein